MSEPSVWVCFLSGDEVHEMQPRARLGGEFETGKASRVSGLAMVLLRLLDCFADVRVANHDAGDE